MRMAATETSSGKGELEHAACARDFVVNRLAEAESPLSPSELASEYGCSDGHVRNILADLMDEGVAERVGRGQYVDTTSETADVEADVVTDFEPDTFGVAEATTSGEETDSSPDPSADGGPRSEDRDTTDEDDQGDGETESVGEIEDESVAASGGGIPLPVDPRTLMLVVALLAVAYVGYKVVSDSSDQDDEEEEQVDAQAAVPRTSGMMG